MITCEHLVYGQFNGVGYKLVKSEGVDQLISYEAIEELTKLSKPGSYVSWLPPNTVIVSFVRQSRDEKGRAGVWLHSILMTAQDFLNLVPTQFFDQYFVEKLDKPPKNLEPLKVETK